MVSRPEPLAVEPKEKRRFSGDLGLGTAPPPPEPAGIFDEIRRALKVPATFVGNHPHLCGLILILILGVLVGSCGRAIFGSDFVG